MGALWRELWRAIWKGLLIVAAPFFLYSLIDLLKPSGGVPTLQRGAHVWLYYWPTVFWSHGDHLKDKDELATFLINLLTYSAIAFVAARLRKKSIPNDSPNVVIKGHSQN